MSFNNKLISDYSHMVNTYLDKIPVETGCVEEFSIEVAENL